MLTLLFFVSKAYLPACNLSTLVRVSLSLPTHLKLHFTVCLPTFPGLYTPYFQPPYAAFPLCHSLG